ncbi:MAG: hypothetical protein JXN62_00805, partial [Bacteroidales bacterium]|nr:hypothetical protein [Bacteroidales bacterium]
MKKYLIISLILVYPGCVCCQESTFSHEIVNIAEQLASDEADQEMVNLYLEQLYELRENPVSINTADETELSRLFFLTAFQVRSLADHIIKKG